MNEEHKMIHEAFKRFRLVTNQRPPSPDVVRTDADAPLLRELLKFLAIRGVADGDRMDGFTIGMRTGPIDDLWHRWLLWTGDYARACDFALGHMVHHASNSPDMSPEEWLARHLRFRAAYVECWGEVPALWGTLDGVMAEFNRMVRYAEGSV